MHMQSHNEIKGNFNLYHLSMFDFRLTFTQFCLESWKSPRKLSNMSLKVVDFISCQSV